jgi:hypothetical protein
LETFDFTAIPTLNKPLVLELTRCEYVVARENIIALGNSGTGKTHIAVALGLAACQRGFPVGFTTAAGLVHQLTEAKDERRLLRLQAQLTAVKLLFVDELGYVPLSRTGAELLFETLSQRHERGATIVTANLPFEEWTSIFASERLTGAPLDRLQAKLLAVKEAMRRRMHQPTPQQGGWLRQVVTGYLAYHAVPVNIRALQIFRDCVVDRWRRSLRRRGQRDKTTWERIKRLADDYLPRPRILHPWPEQRFAVKHPRWEPYAGMPPVRFCAGGAQ